MKAAETRFSPEFRNRIDEIVVFSPLTLDEVKQIAQLYLEKTRRQMKRQGKSFEITERALDLVTEKGFSTQYGARFLKRYIDERVKLPITMMWKSGSNFIVDVEDGEVTAKVADTPDKTTASARLALIPASNHSSFKPFSSSPLTPN